MRGLLRSTLLAALLLASTASACPCMDALPALEHNPVGDPTPQRVRPEPGCQSAAALDATPTQGLATVFRDGPGAAWLGWNGEGALARSADAWLAGPAQRDGARLADARADGSAWVARLGFKPGSAPAGADPQGLGSFRVVTAIVDATGTATRAGPALEVVVDNQGGTGYPVAGSTFVIRDDMPHVLLVEQRDGRVRVLLDGNEASAAPAIGGPDECVLVGLAGPAPGRAATIPVLVSGFTLGSARNEAAEQLARYRYAAPPALPPERAAPVDPCALPDSCCITEAMTRLGADKECVAACTTTGLGAVDAPGPARPGLLAARARHPCVLWTPGAPAPTTWWRMAAGANETAGLELPDARLLRGGTTDEVMYDDQDRTQFGCDRIGDAILLEVRYTDAELAAAGLAEADLQLLHWDGETTRTLAAGMAEETALGLLRVQEAGHDLENNTAWALVSLTDTLEGLPLNNNFATVLRSDGAVLGNAYGLGVLEDRGTPMPAWPAIVALAALALLLGRRGRRA
ncbi:MAG: hypothetical protein QOD77_316 [Thermoplasmata archaeon]|nr:hypothetical protein [Thermoplasmata archaeon]